METSERFWEANGEDNIGPDGFVITPDTPDAEMQRLFNRLERERLEGKQFLGIAGYPSGAAALAQAHEKRIVLIQAAYAPEERVALIQAAYARGNWLFDVWKAQKIVANRTTPLSHTDHHRLSTILADLSQTLLSQEPAFDTAEISQLLELAVRQQQFANSRPWYRFWDGSDNEVLKAITGYIVQQGMLISWLPLLEQLRDVPRAADHIRSLHLAQIFGYDQLGVMPTGALWANCALQELAALETTLQANWILLLKHVATLDTARKPSAKWRQAAKDQIETVGKAEIQARLPRWLTLVGTPVGKWRPNDVELNYLCGLVWLASAVSDSQLCTQIGWVAEVCGDYLRCCHVCYDALATMNGLEPLRELTRLQTKTSHQQAQKLLDKTLTTVAKRSGLSRYDLDDLAVPTFALEMPGQIQQSFGRCAVTITFTGLLKGIWHWIGSDGKAKKTLPLEVKRSHTAALDALKTRVQNIEQMREFQSARIENFYRGQHDWSLPDWQERYATHPLLSTFAHTLIWQLTPEQTDQSPEVKASVKSENAAESLEAVGAMHNSAPKETGFCTSETPETLLGIWRTDHFENMQGIALENSAGHDAGPALAPCRNSRRNCAGVANPIDGTGDYPALQAGIP